MCVRDTDREREGKGGGEGRHALCVSAHLYSKLVFPFHPSPSSSLCPSFPALPFMPFLLPINGGSMDINLTRT